jgi:hypothetical protein
MACNTDLSNLSLQSFEYKNKEFPHSDIFKSKLITVCPNCGFGFLISEPSIELINDFYSNEYRNPKSSFFIDFSRMSSLKSIDARSLGQIYLGLGQIVFRENDVFLDLGPGSGNSFSTANLVLERPICYGVELNAGAKEFYERAYGAKTFVSISQFVKEGLKAKLIILSHSLEHFKLSEISELMNKLKMALAPEGVVVIEVPNDDLTIFGSTRENDSPHLLFFNQHSLTNLVTKYGFEVVAFTKVGNTRISSFHISPIENGATLSFLTTYIDLARLRALLTKIILHLFRKIFKNYDFFPKQQSKNLLKQFSQGENRDCLRIVIKFNQG